MAVSSVGVGIKAVTQDLAEAFGMKTPKGAVITQLDKDGPAEKAGLQVGDILIAVNGQEVKNANDIPVKISTMRPGTKVDMTVLRNGKQETVSVTVAETPNPEGVKTQEKASTGKLGVSVRPLAKEELQELELKQGLLVTEVRGAAARAGLLPRDIILSANGKPINTAEDLAKAIQKSNKIALLVQRQQSRIFIAIDLKKN